ncbi:uncharacterized protein LOC121424034 isoform X2 [Lytechinus variegatus]|uniref:uncharacterized protein LOC121424034 isoform X2 n=1 Tax=Lytechinus variegatus TaxID=7654 RepID=UPI001BB1D9C4|nr:uncharacterized protein LOC121424034 isoform X2 [Lytechinus variegatus]
METSQSPPKLKKAVKKVKKKKMPLAATARKYNIPERTLRDKVSGRHSKKGIKDTNKNTPSPSTNQNVKEENTLSVEEKPQRVKKRRAGYSQEDMELAVRMVKKKEMTLRAAAKKFNVPKSTLHDKVLGRTAVKCNTGRASFLTAAEEALLSNWALQTSDKDTPSPLPINRNDKEENPIAVDEKRVKKRRVGYSQEDMELAVRMVKKKEMTVLGRTAVKCNTGMASFLTAAEEALLSNWALQTSDKDTPSPLPINRNDKEENPIAVDEKPQRVKKRRAGYSQEDMELAVRMVKKKEMTLRAAAKKFNVPRSTLHDKVLGRTAVNCKFGMASFLTAAEETLLSNWVQQMSRIGQCPAKKDIIQVVKKILDDDGRETPFKNNQPGERWFNLFLKRHPELAPGTPILKSKVPNLNFVSPALYKHLTVPLASDSPRLKRENTDETDDLSNSVRLKTSREKKSKQTEEEESVTIKTNIITIVVNGNKKPEVHVRYGEDLDL